MKRIRKENSIRQNEMFQVNEQRKEFHELLPLIFSSPKWITETFALELKMTLTQLSSTDTSCYMVYISLCNSVFLSLVNQQ